VRFGPEREVGRRGIILKDRGHMMMFDLVCIPAIWTIAGLPFFGVIDPTTIDLADDESVPICDPTVAGHDCA
jgi:hypothetical protein